MKFRFFPLIVGAGIANFLEIPFRFYVDSLKFGSNLVLLVWLGLVLIEVIIWAVIGYFLLKPVSKI